MVAPYKNLYAVPKESFDAFIKHKTGSFPNVKSLKVNQLNFNDGNKIKPQHLGSDLHTNNISRARVNAGGQTSLSSTEGGGVEQLNLGDQSQHIPNTSARVNVGGQTSLSSTGDGGVEQLNLGDQSQAEASNLNGQPSNVEDQNNSSSVSFFDATGEPQENAGQTHSEAASRHFVDSPIIRSPQSESFYVSPPKKQLFQPPKKPRRPSISTACLLYTSPSPRD